MANSCRICFDENKTLFSLETEVEFHGTKLTCMQMYKSITGLEETMDICTNAYRHICISCFGELNSCYKFQQMAIKSFNIFIGHILDQPYKQVDKHSEPSNEVDPENQGRHSASNEEEYLDVDYLEDQPLAENGTSMDKDQLVQIDTTIVDSKLSCPNYLNNHKTEAVMAVKSICSQANKEEFICPVCRKMFNSRKTLRQHSRTHLNPESRRHKCRFCEKAFNFGHHLRIHERTHTNQKPFQCLSCGKTFASKDRLSNHRMRHEERLKYACELCGTCFRSKKVLKMHSILKHDAPVGKFDPIKCDHCGKELFSKSATSAHMKGPCSSKTYNIV
ncbi:zinc finger protein 729-like [Armigeres subalbatus]|uniref:zinc finger protein 729-like n=1 Tax=Armigeres subalbatus TaxID=124917 RepID=UPI002ED14B69